MTHNALDDNKNESPYRALETFGIYFY